MTAPLLLTLIGGSTGSHRAAGRLLDHGPFLQPGLPADRRRPAAHRDRGDLVSHLRVDSAERAASSTSPADASASRSGGDATAHRRPRGTGTGTRTAAAGVSGRAAAAGRGAGGCGRLAGRLAGDRRRSVRSQGAGRIARGPAGTGGTDHGHAPSAGPQAPSGAAHGNTRGLGSEAHDIRQRSADPAGELSRHLRPGRRAGRVRPASRRAAPAPAGGAGRC